MDIDDKMMKSTLSEEMQDSFLISPTESRKLIENYSSYYNISFVVNMADDSFKVISIDSSRLGEDAGLKSFSDVKTFTTANLPDYDRQLMTHELNYGTIRERLKDEKSYNVEYRVVFGNVTIWHQMNVTEISDDKVAIAFARRDSEIIRRRLEAKRYDEYFALFAVDCDTEMIKVMKNEEGFDRAPVGTSVPYTPYVQELAAGMEDEPREFFTKISRLDYVRREFAEDDKRTYSYKSKRVDGGKWVDVTAYVILRHSDGTPAMFTLGFGKVDALATVRKDYQERLNEDMQMISGLAGEYNALYYMNIAAGFFKVYSLDEDKFPGVREFINSASDPIDMYRKFSASYMVHPDDRHILQKLDLSSVIERLAHSKKVSYRFRLNIKGEYHWTEMEILKYEAVDEPANILAVGFAERDAEIRSEQTLKNCFKVLGKDITPDEAIIELLALTGEFYAAEHCNIFEYEKSDNIANNTYTWCAEGAEPMKELVKNVPMEDVEGWNGEFISNGAFYMENTDNERISKGGKERLDTTGVKNLIAAPILNGEEIVGFISVDNPTKGRTNLEVMKTVAIVVFSEMLKRNERKEQQLKAALEAADIANKSKTSFLFNMSHDIRTPMNAIRGFTGMARKCLDDREKVADYLEKIDTSGQQLLTLINQVLEMARIEAGRMDIEESPVNVVDEFNASVTVIGEQARTSGLKFSHKLGGIEHCHVLGDKAKMNSITFNITGNAMKYTPPGGNVDISLEEIASRREGFASFTFTVSDTGIGMSEDYLKTIFEPFTREKSSTVSKIQGTGLGMAIVKEFVELMGGNIEVQSEPGKGTRFAVTVDFRIDESAGTDCTGEETEDYESFEGRRALLVEDNELNREIAVSILEDRGMEVEGAADGMDAVDLMKKRGPEYYDIILMDIQMPIMGGYEATKEIRNMYPEVHIPIIALSANAFAEDRIASIEAGMDDHVAKPIDVPELFKVIGKFLKKS